MWIILGLLSCEIVKVLSGPLPCSSSSPQSSSCDLTVVDLYKNMSIIQIMENLFKLDKRIRNIDKRLKSVEQPGNFL